MIPISIDISPIIDAFEIAEKNVPLFRNAVLKRAVSTYEYYLGQEISKLSSTRRMYQNSLSTEFVGDNTAIVTLTGKGEGRVALMLEEGTSPFDIKKGFSESDKKTLKRDGGWYLTIPFREATSEALGESGAFSGKLPKEIQKAAKANSGKPLSLLDLPEKFREKKISHAGYKHKSPLYQGVKHEKGQYTKFRRVSDNSDYNSWIHSGFEARKFMDKAANKLEQNIGDIIDSVTNDFFG